jgi:hypothetical protein
MKAKYYLNCSILEAQQGTRPSFPWGSIQGSCNLLEERLIWCVGNGEKIRIWQDKWIPQPSTYQIKSRPLQLDPQATIRDVMEGDQKGWNFELVNQIFSQEEVKLILSIQLCGPWQDDALIWRGTAKGIFSVRSAYHLQLELDRNDQATSSQGGHKLNAGLDFHPDS